MEVAAAAGEVRRLQGGRGADSGEGRERGSGEEGERRHQRGGAPAAHTVGICRESGRERKRERGRRKVRGRGRKKSTARGGSYGRS